MKPLKFLYPFAWLGILCFVWWMSGCTGKTSTDHFIDVTVVDKATMTPIENAQLSLLQLNSKSSLTSSTIVLSGETDESGTFQFELRPFKNKDASEIRIDAGIATQNAVGGFPLVDILQIGTGFVPVEKALMDVPVSLDILTDPYAFIEVIPMNGSDPDPTRRVSITLTGQGYPFVFAIKSTSSSNFLRCSRSLPEAMAALTQFAA